MALSKVFIEAKLSVIFKLHINIGIDGDLTDWSAPGQCSRSCGGGVQFKTKTCTDPKPSLNGRDCDGTTKEIAVKQWCNTQVGVTMNWTQNVTKIFQ